MNNYETVFIVTPVLSDAQVQEVADKFQGVITENGGQIVNKESWGLRKLAYPIQKKTTGFYFLVEFTGEGSLIGTLETQYRRDERTIQLPAGFSPQEVQLVRQFVAFVQYQKEAQQRGDCP
mgnify:CR=1 FL=1